MDHVQLRKEFKAFKDAVGKIDSLLAQIEKLEKDRQGNLPKLVATAGKAAQAVGGLEEAGAWQRRLRGELAGYEKALEGEKEQLQRRFGSELAKELKLRGLDLSGNLPDLECGFVTIAPDLERGEVTIWFGPRQEKLEKCGLKPAEVARRVEELRRRLGSGLGAEEFHAVLRQAMERAGLGGAGLGAAGKPQSLGNVLTEVAFLLQKPAFRQDPSRERFQNYTRADFGFDLYRMQLPGASPRFSDSFSLVGSTRAQTKSRAGFIWVPQQDSCRGATYSEIQWKGAGG